MSRVATIRMVRFEMKWSHRFKVLQVVYILRIRLYYLCKILE